MNYDLNTFLRDFLPENACKKQRIMVEEGMRGTSEYVPWTPKERGEEPPF